ncbi:MAG: InlB B-repeat-containing protein [Erysipelotrichaceae bacterium]|nr:InlB B-repeat-containing protein [Erysipelotrichaceae bacterium]
MKKKFNNLFTLLFSALLVINMIPGNVFADEEDQLPAEVPVEAAQEDVQAEASEPVIVIEEVKEETPAEEIKEEVKEEAPAPVEEKKEETKEEISEVRTEEKKEEVKAANSEEQKEAVLSAEAPAMMNEVKEAVEVPAEVVEESPVKQEKIKITVNFVDIMNTNGTTKTGSASSTLSEKVSSWRILAAKFKNQIPYTDVSVQGTKYHFTGEWAYEDGSIVSIPMEFKYADYNVDTTVNVHPVYEITEAARLNFYKIDNISYGSGSWANTSGSFTTYTNTLKAPSAKAHYQFLYWQDAETGKIYNAGDKYSIKASEIGDNNTKDVRLYAIWQPSLTLRYHDANGNTTESKETFESLSVYAQSAATMSGCTFKGWSLTPNGAVLENGTSYTAPSITHEKVDQMIINLYPVYSTSYEVEHYIEDLDGSFTLKDSESFEDVTLNSKVDAEVRSYEGFSFADGDTNGTVKAGLVMKLYYSRNSYKVSYEYENAPENAPAVPETKEYRFGSDVKAAEVKETEGYTFSGWDKAEFTMPAEDVVIKGSYEINRYSVRFLNDDGSLLELDEEVAYGTMASYDGITPEKKSDGIYTYTFEGWSEELREVKEDQVYTAGYKAELIPVVTEKITDDGEPQAPSSPVNIDVPEDPEIEIAETLSPVNRPAETAPAAAEEIEIAEENAPLAGPETIAEEQQVIADVTIEEEAVPQAQYKTWALYNLIAMIITVLTGLFMSLSFFRNDKEEQEENTERRYSKFLGLIPMIASVVAFILTEDMRNLMVLKDRFTIPMIVIALFELVLAFITRNRKYEEEKEEEEELLIEA